MKDEMNEEKKKSVVDRVMDDIITDIIEGRLCPGDQIPTEMELCKKYGAGRNSVREAIKKLQAYGVVYIKRADGTFVSETYNQKMLDPLLYSIILQKNSWKDFVELRSVIDIGTFYVIMDKPETREILPEMRDLLNLMDKEMHNPTPSVDAVMEYDKEFHLLMAEGTHNPQLVTITEYITRLTLPSRRQTVRDVLQHGDIDNFINLHRQMIEVIENRQVELIEKTVTDHYVYWK
ncbi:MAG: GntR family transcriptional regulator [Lachnospiraceae bacterium]|nr:GntR family transcriptional regulator [Lachnospiraceae bacterium]